MSKAVLVTGGGGYIGSHTVLVLLENGHTVVVVDNYTKAIRGDAKPVAIERVEVQTGKTVTFYEGDVADCALMTQILIEKEIACVMHLAGFKAVAESIDYPLAYYANNVGGFLQLIEACKRAKVFNFIFSSSSTVYGSQKQLPMTETDQAGIGITNAYGSSKYMVETILSDICASDQRWNVIVLRYFNPIGAHESGTIGDNQEGIPSNLMPFVSQVALGKRPYVNVYGDDWNTKDGTCVRDYIHVMDVARGHSDAMTKLSELSPFGCKIYNLGIGAGLSVLEIVKAMEKVTGKKIAYKMAPRRQGDVGASYCDASLARKELLWTAEHTVDDMCQSIWKWQSNNPDGY